MSSSFELTLDTQGPILSIEYPTKVSGSEVGRVDIFSSEDLLVFQEVYTIDIEGERRDYIFARTDSRHYMGFIDFSEYPSGSVELHVSVKDIVDNESHAVRYVRVVGDFSEVDGYVTIQSRTILIKVGDRVADLDYQGRQIDVEMDGRQTGIGVGIRTISVGISKDYGR